MSFNKPPSGGLFMWKIMLVDQYKGLTKIKIAAKD